ncbi:MAG: sulfatase-like hydrolase/transferase, partial [Leptospira sp.]|nr:sulfatase-like hydrolase/transferase [Leptospira sp.]
MIRFLFWVVPVSVPGVDLLFRFNQISKFQNLEILYYSVSILLSLILYWLLHDAIARTRKESTRVFLSITSGLFYSVCIVGTYTYFRITNIIPNLYTFSYMFEETYNSYTLARDSFSFLYLLLIFAVGAVFSSSIYFSAKSVLSPMHRILRYSQIVIAISVLLLLGNNVRFVDQIYVSDVNALSCFQRQATNLITGTKIGSFGLLSRNRIFLKDSYSGKKYNVLLIIGESLRRKNMSLYDYQRKTTPFLDQLRLTHRKEFFVFPKAFSNSGSTLLSVPSILTGITPVQDISLANSYPLFWEYAKAQKYSTFYITSHSHKWNNFQNFFSNADIDFLWNKEISNLPAFNDLGIDDRETVAVFQNRIKGFGKENK